MSFTRTGRRTRVLGKGKVEVRRRRRIPAPAVSLPEIRTATAADLNAIARVQKSAPEASQWDPADYLCGECLVAMLDGQLPAFLAGRQVARDETEILNLAVLPAFRRRGLARRLVETWLEEHPGRCFLEVRESNLAARQLYERAGFHLAGRRPEYYINPPEAAIVMAF
jgi:ribosomal protein S18 acetylase RimI-like enzyme